MSQEKRREKLKGWKRAVRCAIAYAAADTEDDTEEEE